MNDRQSVRVTRSQSRSTTQFNSPSTFQSDRQSVKEKWIYISSVLIISARVKLLEFQEVHLEGEEEKEEVYRIERDNFARKFYWFWTS